MLGEHVMRTNHFVILAFFSIALLFSGCTIPVSPGGGNATSATDAFGTRLEALNSEIAAARDPAAIANLTSAVSAAQSVAAGNGAYQKYLPLIEAQSRALLLANATILYGKEAGGIARNGVDCSRDYGALASGLMGMNYTKQVALSKAGSYLASNPSSSVTLLISLINSTDTEGMYLFGTLVVQEQAAACPVSKKPSKTYSVPLGKDDAVNLVVSEVAGSGKYFIYYPGAELKSGDVVSVDNAGGNVTTRTMNASTWFFMLDPTPMALWSHGVKFVFIDAATAAYYVTDEVSNPQINGVDYWYTLDSRLDKAWVVYPENPDFNATLSPERSVSGPLTLTRLQYYYLGTIANVPAGTDCSKLDCCKGVGKKKALIVNGVDEDWFQRDADNMYKFLQGQMGYSKDDITYLAPNNKAPEANEITTMASFWGALSRLANESQCCDKVFIYITGHGSNITYYIYKNKATGAKDIFTREDALALDPAKWEYTHRVQYHHRITINPLKTIKNSDNTTTTTGNANGGRTYASDIALALDKIKSCYVTVLYDSCFSGAAPTWLAGRGRTIITTSDTTSSYGSDDPLLGSVWNNNWMLGQTINSDEADTNGDGTVSPQGASDYANRKTKSQTEAHQTGTYTPPKPPCTCCHVNCDSSTNYLCSVVEGDGTNDPRCKKVGDGCTYTVPLNQSNQTTGNQTTNRTQTGGGTTEGNTSIAPRCPGTNAVAECLTDSDCPKYRYCDTKACACKQYPLICGDGHIAAGEACDTKANPTGCPYGQTCDAYCRCQQPSSVCGDGNVTGIEQCDVGKACSQGLTCNLNTCQCESSTTNGTATGGGSNTTPQVPGGGGSTTPQPYCGDGIVNGNEQCETNAQCSSGYHCSGCQCVQTPGYCGDGIINGNEACDPKASPSGCYGQQVCSTGCTCVSPPTLNCNTICGYTSGAQAIAGSYGSSTACNQGTASYFGSAPTCNLLCTYSWYYQVSNIAGSASCCCGMKKLFPCSNCPSAPGTQPYCPGQSTCTANAPSWYSPP